MAIGVLSSDESVAWGNTVILSSHASPALSVEIRASYGTGRMLGSGEVIGKLQMSWDELLDHGDELFDLTFPPVHNVYPSFTLKAVVVHACDDQDNMLSDSLVDSDITRDTDAGHARLAEYMMSRTVSYLNDAVQHFQSMMKKCITPSFVTIGQGQPGAGKGKALLAVDSELELVHKLVPATAKRITISGDTATRAGALQALEENTWVHLACHGKQDPTQPYDSHFVMKDEHLTLLDIMERDIPHAEFAFLSACHTAVGDEKTPDEVIHLAAGLQFLGFKSVIGTLWEVNDAVAKHVVEAFYKYMFMDLKDGKGVVMDCSKAA
ncbi:CHAT domain-containing protein [Suillus cothurnatus]|nr:CHAT domain-containing protein [Suillus cothurnatus]